MIKQHLPFKNNFQSPLDSELTLLLIIEIYEKTATRNRISNRNIVTSNCL